MKKYRPLFVAVLAALVGIFWFLKPVSEPIVCADPAEQPAYQSSSAALSLQVPPSLPELLDRVAAASDDTDHPSLLTDLEAYRHIQREWIHTDPQAFLDQAPSPDQFARIPDEFKPYFGRPVEWLGAVDLLWETSQTPSGALICRHRNTFHNGESGFEVILPARYPVQAAPVNVVQAVILEDQMVLRAPPAPISFRELEHLAQHGNTEAETLIRWLAADDGGVWQSGGSAETPYQVNQIQVLFIRVDFEDLSGEPVSQSDLETTLASVDTHIDAFSYGTAGITFTVTESVYRMPQTGEFYAVNGANSQIQTDARALVETDYTLEDFDVIAVYFPRLASITGSQITYGGLASIGGGSHWINGINSVRLILHEFGHNYGLYHANYLHPAESLAGSYFTPGLLEYGDIFDVMGTGNPPEGHFSHLAKAQLEWLPPSKIAEADTSGVWRIYRFDDPNASSNPTLALKVPMSPSINYWVGFRQGYTSSAYNLDAAAYVVGENLGPQRETALIDMTPNSQATSVEDRRDAGLPVGGTYYDANAGVRFNALALGGTAPSQWIDVEVLYDPRITVAETVLEVDGNAGHAEVIVERTLNGTGTVQVDYAAHSGTALAGTHFHSLSGTVTWADGELGGKRILIPLIPDSAAGLLPEFTLTLTNPSGAVILSGYNETTVRILSPGQRFSGFAPPFFNTTVHSIVPLGDGRVVIGGNIPDGIGGFSHIRHIARLHPDGSVDGSFNTGAGFNDEVYTLLLQPDGKLLAGGDFISYNGAPAVRLARLNPDGSIDSSFSANIGNGPNDTVHALALEADGSILVGGSFNAFDDIQSEGMIRLRPDGSADTEPPLFLPFESTFNTTIRALRVEPDGKIMVGGSFYVSGLAGGLRSGIARLHPDGTRDAVFNPGAGTHHIDSTTILMTVFDITSTLGGHYILSGDFSAYDQNAAPNIAKIDQNGGFVSTFSPPSFDFVVSSVLTQPTQSIVTGGWFNSPEAAFTRLTSNGEIDPDFYSTGTAGNIFDIQADHAGHLWVGGNFFSFNGESSRPIVKLAGGATPYDLWVQSKFTPAQILSGDAEPSADPDGDGIPNLMEFALGTDPMIPDDAPTALAIDPSSGLEIVSVGSDQFLQLTINKAVSSPGVWSLAQFSGDLQTWTPQNPLPGSPEFLIIENSEHRLVIRDQTPVTPENPRFGRGVLRIPE